MWEQLCTFQALFLWIWFVKLGPVCKSDTDLKGKTVLITGGNAGIGKATAIELAKRNARVIIASRNSERGADAVREIRQKSGNESVHFMKLDLADFESIQNFSKEFSESESRLDILVNNAGLNNCGTTKQGFDLIFGVNQLGPFLLTHLLFPLMRKTSQHSPVRIVNLSSSFYEYGKIDFENLNPRFDEKSTFLEMTLQYANSKLMAVYFTTELDKKFKTGGLNITTFAVDPGYVPTNIALDNMKKHGGFFLLFARSVFILLATRFSTYYGCQTTVHCCVEKGIESDSGNFFLNLKTVKLNSCATNAETSAKLWQKCEELCEVREKLI